MPNLYYGIKLTTKELNNYRNKEFVENLLKLTFCNKILVEHINDIIKYHTYNNLDFFTNLWDALDIEGINIFYVGESRDYDRDCSLPDDELFFIIGKKLEEEYTSKDLLREISFLDEVDNKIRYIRNTLKFEYKEPLFFTMD